MVDQQGQEKVLHLVELSNLESMSHVPGQVTEAVPEVVDNGEGEDELGGEDEDRADAQLLHHAQVVGVGAWQGNCTQGEPRQNRRLHKARNSGQIF